MRILFFLLCVYCASHLTKAQSHQYQVTIDGIRAGSYFQSVETDQNTHTFSELNLLVPTFDDTLRFQTRAHFIESDSGWLKSVEWTNILLDTTNYLVIANEDSLISMSSSDTSRSLSGRLLGPEKIRRLSIDSLDSIGSKVRYSTFSTEFNRPINIQRELIGYSIEKAQKLRIIKETLGDAQFGISKYDKDFNLLTRTDQSVYGEIKIERIERLSPSQFFESEFFAQNWLISNIRFSDPNQINAIKVNIEGLDSTSATNLVFTNQKLTQIDNSYYLAITNNPSIAPDSFDLPKPEIIRSTDKVKNILDSLNLDATDLESALTHLIEYSKTKNQYPNLILYQLALTSNIPTRLVYGYAYEQWFWKPKVWIEVVRNGNWTSLDLTSNILSNALKIALYKSNPGDMPNESYLAQQLILENIQVESFELDGRKLAASNQVLPYYFENPVYENEGLGIRFNIPDGFIITNDGTQTPSSTFLTLENNYSEKITCSQLILEAAGLAEQEAKARIREYTGEENTELNYDKKLNLWYGYSGQKGAVAIVQGRSLIFIAINHQDPDFMRVLLTKKNLHLKY